MRGRINFEAVKTLVITGGIGSGKSVVCRYLASKGIPTYDSDFRAKALYYENPLIVQDIEDALGESIKDIEGIFDKRKLGAIVFGNREKLRIVEEIVHPMVYDDFVHWRDTRIFEGSFVVFESAIFLDKPLFHPLADAVLMIDAPRDIRIRRTIERDGCSEAEVESRMDAQRQRLDFVGLTVMNDSDIQTLFKRVDEAIEKLKDKLI